ncbi:hypothetical protein [Marinoscillum furvescens]|uniref:Uncharacterized protein n=1 Tax=Marinoscillum furvescens DSM 4134 TaxID=1122208 RepID=A0A3D9KZJ6_MARFU|nr:hypothetical protein [Marinoscillum furvescens]RED95987.1 hypothetical protein C7460_11645 [Marinoscillum furvescens DSM 4134]
MISSQQKTEALQRILDSKTFKKATTTHVLLKLLADATLSDKELTTVTIGMELFGKKYDPEKSDVNIRVNISHLRKRLKKYYADEGQSDPIIVSIAPGQYQVSFTKKKSEDPVKSRYALPIVTAIALLAIAAATYFYTRPSDAVWTSLINNQKETALYIGDVFGYRGPGAFGAYEWHRDARINSTEEFYELVNTNPEVYGELKPGGYSYVVFENSAIVKPFTRYFTKRDYDFSLRPSSGFTTKLIREQNTIYTGPVYIQMQFVEVFNQLSKNIHLEVQMMPERLFAISYTGDDGEPKRIDLNSTTGSSEYALIGGFDGPNNTRHYMFFSNHGMGLTSLVDYFTNEDSLAVFSERHLEESSEFVAVYYVEGQNRTNMHMELRFLDNNR